MTDVAIIDYKLGNLYSVYSACKYVGINAKITSDRNEILNAKSAILPGVGAFGEAVENMVSLNLFETTKEFIDTKRPFLGICLGLQLLFDESEEFGLNKGLGIVGGKVKKFDFENNKNDKFPVPQIGWNTIYHERSWEDTLLSDLQKNDYMYFVHSFYVVPDDKNCILTKSKYGNKEYCSSILIDNIFASQFHPEKSGEKGLNVYRKFKSLL
tara:strand:- start:2186 stop:2821 length:636 start_codon:yes stop_codon:yes gene_type:complete